MTQFSGETAWESIVSDEGLDIVEEELFLAFVKMQGYTKEVTRPELDMLYESWTQTRSEVAS
jgi:hypothetical protein